MSSKQWLLAVVIAAMVVMGLFSPSQTRAQTPDDGWVSKVISIQGEAFVKRSGQTEWLPVGPEALFYAGDALRVAVNSRAAILLSNESVLRIDQYTTLVFQGIEKEKTFLLRLLEGAAYFFSREKRSLKVATPFVNGVVEGTEFLVRVETDSSRIILYEGALLAQNAQGETIMQPGQGVVAEKDKAPVLTTPVRPREAVQWALYYPPVLAVRPDDIPPQDPDDWQTRTHQSMQRFQQGDVTGAFAAIDGLGDTVDDARFYTWRAGLNLSVGRTAQARLDIDRALALDKASSDAMALRSIVAVAQNRTDDALQDAQQAVAMNDQSVAARIALSYALQARFDLPAARDAARSATEADPASTIAWSRLAELHLANGYRKDALDAVSTAMTLPPVTAHTHAVLGFVYLTRIKTDQARAAFEKAIALDSAAPLPRLGLGLAKIREGDLSQGRADIEIAAGLAPDNALIRSYLGKAYFDEKREPLDERQFEMAKQLDPNDPTPWFYDAIRKQTLNRPGEALADMQKAIELNDNRAVYRSRLMLDQDLAARSAALGRIYSDLSFQSLALDQGRRSLEADPTNYSAHRLLADMYASRPRHEIARVSELLQSQLLQPLNLTPLQPQLAETNPLLLEGSGPAAAGSNEFNPLFTRNRTAVQVTGVVAENDTWGDNVILSGLHQWFSYSVGQYHYETDGFRPNNDLDRNIYNAFVQAAVSPEFSIQAEYRYKETENGDQSLSFAPESFEPNQRYDERINNLRLGLNYSPTPTSTFLGSFVYGESEKRLDDQFDFYQPPPGEWYYNEISSSEIDTDVINGELQYLWTSHKQNVVVGGGYIEEDWTLQTKISETFTIPPDPPESTTTIYPQTQDITRHNNAYLYYYFKFIPRVTLTLAGAYDDLDTRYVSYDRFSPKVGAVWLPHPRLTLRAAWLRTVKRPLSTNQTLEPTQIAGFNQFFDDINGARTEVYGIGLDTRLATSIHGGIETTWREVETPFPDSTTNTVSEETADEQLHHAYIYWTPAIHWSFSLESEYETLEQSIRNPLEMTTIRTPVTLGYFHPSGIFCKGIATYVDQAVRYNFEETELGDNFWVVDAAIGFRLPKRWGIVTLGVKNLFDQSFSYQDANYATDEPVTPRFFPERMIYGRITLSI